ncbi:NAD-dependent epimerase/dehydratase family protein [Patescibacteria group bacterium]|nr:NAD-dependent epimerase/dehydratase family protein [Patescibacteria group bacterium]
MSLPSRWVIVGASGFLGTNLLHALAPEDGEVVAIDRRAARWPVIRDGIRYLERDSREVESYREELVPGAVVVHMASVSYPGKAEQLIESDIQDNVLGTIRLAQVCADRGVRSFIFISSGGAVYGDVSTSPIPEDALTRPVSAYGAMKVSIEHYLHINHHLRGLPVACLRPSNPFGLWHGGSGQGAVNVFLAKMLRGGTIDIWGDGSQVRDFVAAEDVVSAIRTVGLLFASGSETFNVGSGIGRSITEILSETQRVAGVTADIRYLPARSVDVRTNVLDIRKMKERFGWEPTVPFEVALSRACDWSRTSLA